ncbi:copper resistance protein CopC [Aliisedimentitalea scapharcae]|uniref:Copper resistance protein CopC n=1 Tax=Aliisedimentitalea scapharcae TaxID=1524259 RepID=A0ABZ2XR92_9RHOB
MKYFAIGAVLAILVTGASAHSKIETTIPADGAVLASAPAEIDLTFGKDIRLTRVVLSHQDGAAVPLDLGSQTQFGRGFTVPLQSLGQGVYRIEWRGLGMDGHAMTGTFTFAVE